MVKDISLDTANTSDDEDEAKTVAAGDISFIARFLRPFARPYRRNIGVIGLVLMVETAFNFSFPLMTQYLIDDGLLEKDWNVVVWVLSFLCVAAFVTTVLGVLSDYMYTRTATSMTGDLRQHLFDHVNRMSMPFFQRTPTGTITSRFSGDIVATETALVTLVPYFVKPALEVIYSTILLFIFSFWLGLIAFLVFPMVLFLPRIFAKRAFARAYDKRRTEGVLMASVQENVSAQPVLKAFGLAGRVRRDFHVLNARWFGFASKGNFSAALVEQASYSGLYILHIIVFGIGVYWVFTDQMTLGTLIAFEAVFLSMGYALTDVTQYVPNLAQAVGAVHHMDDLLQEKPTLVDRPDAGTAPRFTNAITFEGVGFSYPKDPDDDEKAEADGGFKMENINLTIPKGSFLGIVGASGSGKSSMLNLLLRFHDPTAGAVKLDGIDLRDVTQSSYREQLGVVFQESFLFNASIIDNIRLGKDNATMNEISAAAKLAEVEDFILSLPDGYDTGCGERGQHLSGGQRQRIAIARALVRNPPLLVLDEATSALDAGTEGRLNETLRRIARTRTVVSVTHRLGSVETADKIIVMHDGRIVEDGTHEQLLALGGLYAALWRTQRNAAADTGDDDE